MRISDWSSDVCSSDLYAVRFSERSSALFGPMLVEKFLHSGLGLGTASAAFREQGDADALAVLLVDTQERRRSEEHTSELQSLMRISYAVFCLTKTTQNTNVILHLDVTSNRRAPVTRTTAY